MLWTLRPVGGGVLQHLIIPEETKMNETVFKEGSAACAVLEKMIDKLKNARPVVDTELSVLADECRELSSSGQNDYETAKKALEICIDALDVITADYKKMAADIHEKLESYK